jgi:hypothetical protein
MEANMTIKNESRVLKMLQAHRGDQTYHPLCSLLDLADDEAASIGDKITIHKSLAKYVEPELRQVEFKGASDKPPITMRIVMDKSVDVIDKEVQNGEEQTPA